MKFKFLFALAALGLLATSCNKETESGQELGNGGEKQGVYLTISTEVAPTRAAADTEDATAAELTLNVATPIKVAVFNQGGDLVASESMTLAETATAGEYKTTAPVSVTAGNLFFFVFANDDANNIALPAVGSTLEAFVEDNFDVAFDINGRPTTIATDNKFLLGALWKETTIAPAGGTTAAPKSVDVTIGRLASKVNLLSVEDKTTTGMKGTFTLPAYRLGSLAKAMTQVGDNETANVNPYTKGTLVTSAKHTAGPGTEAAYNDTDYLRYTSADFVALSTPTANENIFYATENTTALDDDGLQHYGNTTYIQVKTKYTPTLGEVYKLNAAGNDVELLGMSAADINPYNDGTFWSGYYKNVRLLFNFDPEASVLADKIETIGKYEDGLNYHKFAIVDLLEDKESVETRNRVLRNHYYEFKVTDFKDLGSYTAEVDPKEPIPAETEVELIVTIKKWDKVEGEVEI